MPIVIAQAPPANRSTLLTGLAEFMDPKHPLTDELMKAQLGFQVFTLDLHDILDGAGLSAAKPAGWRFLAIDSEGRVASSDVTEGNGAVTRRVSGVSYDPLIREAIRASRELSTLPEVREEVYQVTVLRIPALIIEAFWLKSSQGDFLVPVYLLTGALKAMTPYRVDQFFEIVRSLAQKLLDKMAKLPGDDAPPMKASIELRPSETPVPKQGTAN